MWRIMESVIIMVLNVRAGEFVALWGWEVDALCGLDVVRGRLEWCTWLVTRIEGRLGRGTLVVPWVTVNPELLLDILLLDTLLCFCLDGWRVGIVGCGAWAIEGCVARGGGGGGGNGWGRGMDGAGGGGRSEVDEWVRLGTCRGGACGGQTGGWSGREDGCRIVGCWGGGGGGGSGSGADEVGRGRGSVGGSTIDAGGWCAPVVRGDARGGRSGW